MLNSKLEFEGAEIRKEGNEIVVKGEKGELRKTLKHPLISISISGNSLEIKSKEEGRKIKAVIGTWTAIIKNMVEGVKKGYEAKLRMVHSHFPAKLDFKDNKFTIQNFLGQRSTKSTTIPKDIELKIDKNDVIIKGLDKERLGQIAGKIENMVRIRKFDRRVFQDGCYIVQHPEVIGS